MLPRGDGTQGCVQFAVQTALVTIFWPEPVLTVAQVRVAKADGTARPVEREFRVVIRRGHGVGRAARDLYEPRNRQQCANVRTDGEPSANGRRAKRNWTMTAAGRGEDSGDEGRRTVELGAALRTLVVANHGRVVCQL